MHDQATYVNSGFQDQEDRPPPYTEIARAGLYPTLPQYQVTDPAPINTYHTTTAGQPHSSSVQKGARKYKWQCIAAIVVVILGVLVAIAILTWYFVSDSCIMGRSCGANGMCLSSSQWCDGNRDCPGGQDEAQCFRLYGPEFILQSYSSKDEKWKPVCSDGWTKSIGVKTCEQIGYDSNDYVAFDETRPGSTAKDGYMKLKTIYIIDKFVHRALSNSENCISNKAVSLKCIECGRHERRRRRGTFETRIVGGQTVTNRDQWPWQVSLQASGGHRCGGSIITSQWIITAAHCVETISSPFQWKVFAGYLTLSDMRSGSGNSVQRIISHPNYDPKTSNNDIALMKLQTPLFMSSSVRAVCLPNAGITTSSSESAYITGWGATTTQGFASNELRQAKVSLIDRSVCNSYKVYNGQITKSMICAGKLEGGVDTCQGDSGGPLVTEKESLWWLVGDTSWGEGCALRNKPGVYGNVSYFLEWIYEQMQKY